MSIGERFHLHLKNLEAIVCDDYKADTSGYLSSIFLIDGKVCQLFWWSMISLSTEADSFGRNRITRCNGHVLCDEFRCRIEDELVQSSVSTGTGTTTWNTWVPYQTCFVVRMYWTIFSFRTGSDMAKGTFNEVFIHVYNRLFGQYN